MGSYRVVEIVTMPENRVYITRQVGNEAIALLKQKYKVEIWDSKEPIPKETLLTAVGGISGLFCTVSDIIDAGILEAAGISYGIDFCNEDRQSYLTCYGTHV